MLTLRRKAVQPAPRLSTSISHISKRFKSNETHGSDHHGADHDHHHAEAKDEPIGVSFYIILAAIPISLGVYSLSRPKDGKPAALTKLIENWAYYGDKWADRNTLHTKMIEQAAFDRNLFQSSKASGHIELRFPEQFNTGSPWNVIAGHGARNMDHLVEHYQKINRDEEERKLKALSEKEERS
ncbi:hypothetical protein B7494_g8326 [Chlorociboria aeruginascens]|nr:hypothetical protein B7494_g8326 [Chlorociboria aeruginascens]